MARHRSSYAGERRTEYVGFQLTPAERVELESAARLQGATISDYARELLFRRSAAVVAATRRNPEAAGLMRELNALGNNLNQIARHLNTLGELRDEGELHDALRLTKQAIGRVLEL
jgi:hypothetical protein